MSENRISRKSRFTILNISPQTSPLNVRRIGGLTMAENHSSTRPPITHKPHRCQADEDLGARFICHANSTHVLQSLWRGLLSPSGRGDAANPRPVPCGLAL